MMFNFKLHIIMASKFNTVIVLIIYLCIMSCRPDTMIHQLSPKEDPEVKIINNRVVFRDNATFLKIRDQLVRADSKTLEKWENQYGFHSLREAFVKQDEHALALMEEFAFPTGLASFINTNGEFQVGSKISWYDKGFRNDVDNEEQLLTIKKDSTAPRSSFFAGVQDNKREKQVQNVYGVTRNTSSNDKYVKTLDLIGVPEQRRYLYQTYVYTEEYVSEYPDSQKFYTALILKIRLDYYSRRSWPYSGYTWKPTADPRHIEINVRTTGGCSIEVGGQIPDRPGLPSQRKYFTNSPLVVVEDTGSETYNFLESADLYLQTYGGGFNYSRDAVTWDYGISGRISQSKPGFTQTNGQPAEYVVDNQFSLW